MQRLVPQCYVGHPVACGTQCKDDGHDPLDTSIVLQLYKILKEFSYD